MRVLHVRLLLEAFLHNICKLGNEAILHIVSGYQHGHQHLAAVRLMAKESTSHVTTDCSLASAELINHRANDRNGHPRSLLDVFLRGLLPSVVQEQGASLLAAPVQCGQRGVEDEFTVLQASIRR